jgi:hypothetical protein
MPTTIRYNLKITESAFGLLSSWRAFLYDAQTIKKVTNDLPTNRQAEKQNHQAGK